MDDYFALLALVRKHYSYINCYLLTTPKVLAAGTIGTVVVGTNVGIGKHIYDQTGESLIAALKVRCDSSGEVNRNLLTNMLRLQVTYAFVIINSICLG